MKPNAVGISGFIQVLFLVQITCCILSRKSIGIAVRRQNYMLMSDDNPMDWFHSFVELHNLYINEFNAKKEDGERASNGIADYLDLNSIHIDKVLDIPCGIGRVSRGLLERGMSVTGVDISTPFLDEFKRSSVNESTSATLKLVNASFDDFLNRLFSEKYDLIINWWTSFGYHSYEKDLEFFKNLLNVSQRDTILMVETWHREYIAQHRMHFSYKDLGTMVVVNENSFSENDSKVYTIHKYYQKTGKDLIFKGEFDSSIKLYSKGEIFGLLKSAGWEIIDVFNSIETREPFKDSEDRIVLISKPAER